MRSVTRYRVTISGGPNFAYDLCTDKITDEEMEGLGIESIRWDSIVKRYYCKATGDQIVELASSWWVRRIYRARSRYYFW